MTTYPTNFEVFDFSHLDHPERNDIKLLFLTVSNKSDAVHLDRIFRIEAYSFMMENGKGNKIKFTLGLDDSDWQFTFQGRRKYAGFGVGKIAGYFLFIGYYDKTKKEIVQQGQGHIIFCSRVQPDFHPFYQFMPN